MNFCLLPISFNTIPGCAAFFTYPLGGTGHPGTGHFSVLHSEVPAEREREITFYRQVTDVGESERIAVNESLTKDMHFPAPRNSDKRSSGELHICAVPKKSKQSQLQRSLSK